MGYMPNDPDANKYGYVFFVSEADYNDQIEENKEIN